MHAVSGIHLVRLTSFRHHSQTFRLALPRNPYQLHFLVHQLSITPLNDLMNLVYSRNIHSRHSFPNIQHTVFPHINNRHTGNNHNLLTLISIPVFSITISSYAWYSLITVKPSPSKSWNTKIRQPHGVEAVADTNELLQLPLPSLLFVTLVSDLLFLRAHPIIWQPAVIFSASYYPCRSTFRCGAICIDTASFCFIFIPPSQRKGQREGFNNN